jgi:hypothetical protein
VARLLTTGASDVTEARPADRERSAAGSLSPWSQRSAVRRVCAMPSVDGMTAPGPPFHLPKADGRELLLVDGAETAAAGWHQHRHGAVTAASPCPRIRPPSAPLEMLTPRQVGAVPASRRRPDGLHEQVTEGTAEAGMRRPDLCMGPDGPTPRQRCGRPRCALTRWGARPTAAPAPGSPTPPGLREAMGSRRARPEMPDGAALRIRPVLVSRPAGPHGHGHHPVAPPDSPWSGPTGRSCAPVGHHRTDVGLQVTSRDEGPPAGSRPPSRRSCGGTRPRGCRSPRRVEAGPTASRARSCRHAARSTRTAPRCARPRTGPRARTGYGSARPGRAAGGHRHDSTGAGHAVACRAGRGASRAPGRGCPRCTGPIQGSVRNRHGDEGTCTIRLDGSSGPGRGDGPMTAA